MSILVLGGCQPAQDLLDPAELEAQLRSEPDRGAKVGALIGVAVVNHAARAAAALGRAPDPRCTLRVDPGQRWVGELTLERRRGQSLVSSWTETRTLDRSGDAVAMRLAATYQTEIGGRGTQDTEWRIVANDAFISSPGRDGDLWIRREAEEAERERVLSLGEGMLQVLVDSVDGWQATTLGWTAGEGKLRCAHRTEGLAFVDRFVAGAKTRSADLKVTTDRGRQLDAAWTLSDGSVLQARFEDRVVPFEGPIEAPPLDRIVPTAPDRSLARAQELLTKLAAAGLADVASRGLKESAP